MAVVACSIVATAFFRWCAEAEEHPVSVVAVARRQRVQKPRRPAEPSVTVVAKSLNAACAQRGKLAVALGLQTSAGQVRACRSRVLDLVPIVAQLVMAAVTYSSAAPACPRSRVGVPAFPTNVAVALAVVSFSPAQTRKPTVDLLLMVAARYLTAACALRDKPAVVAA